MTHTYYKVAATFFAILGLVLGFSAKVIAQYGAPPAIRFKGIISSKECNIPLKNIQLNITSNNNTQTTYTNPKGEFRVSMFDDYSDETRTITIQATDTDGVASGGHFASNTFIVNVKRYDFDTFYFQLNQLDTPPCAQNQSILDPATPKDKKNLTNKPTAIEGGNEPVFTVIPNPNRSTFTIQFNAKVASETTLFIANDIGNQLFQKKFNSILGNQNLTINLNPLPAGTYYFSLMQGATIATQKVVIL